MERPEVEGVIVATPHSTHLDMISAAASAGKHVFVEKPLTLTVDEAKKANEAASAANVTYKSGITAAASARTGRSGK